MTHLVWRATSYVTPTLKCGRCKNCQAGAGPGLLATWPFAASFIYTVHEYEEDGSHSRNVLASSGKMGSQEGDARVIYFRDFFPRVYVLGLFLGRCVSVFTGVPESSRINLTIVRGKILRCPRDTGPPGMPTRRKEKVPGVGEISGFTHTTACVAAVTLSVRSKPS